MDSAALQAEADLLASIQRLPLRHLEVELADPGETLWRQVHPNNVKLGVLNGEAFTEVDQAAFVGTPDAKYEVSTSMASAVSAQAAHEHYVLKNKSDGSYMVTLADVTASNSRAIDDSATYTNEGDVVGHAFIDFRGMPKKLQRRARSHLAHAATHYGRKFPIP